MDNFLPMLSSDKVDEYADEQEDMSASTNQKLSAVPESQTQPGGGKRKRRRHR